MPSNTARPRIATTAVSIIPVVVPRSSACDVLSSGGGYTLLYLPFSSLLLAVCAPAASTHPESSMTCRGGALLKLSAWPSGAGWKRRYGAAPVGGSAPVRPG
jgi:hypothetical protein